MDGSMDATSQPENLTQSKLGSALDAPPQQLNLDPEGGYSNPEIG